MLEFEKRERFEKLEKPEKAKSPVWIVTFADLMALLMSFFIMLLSAANVENEKFEQVGASVRNALGKQEYVTKSSGQTKNNTSDTQTQMTRDNYIQLTDALKNEIVANTVEVEMHGKIIIVRIHDPAMFDSGEARLNTSFLMILYKLKNILKTMPGQFVVSGHTDNAPILTNKYRSNWELSASRAYSVIAQLIDELKLPPERFELKAYGETQPLVPNNSDMNKARNRRVEIMIDQRDVAEKNSTSEVPNTGTIYATPVSKALPVLNVH